VRTIRSAALSHAPLWLQRTGHVVFGEDNILWDLADTISAIANGMTLHGRDSATIASDTACVAHVVWVSESFWWCKVERGESARFAKHVSKSDIS
jgi:hypothetical protein